ncbi:hypothetical protein [Sulfitobacter sp. S190]|uniref:hypothetical protein n=1 Tax=Sulfitobacter sp. S190 TaxID=2867022 RepID=UPI0021A2DF72|nr:hypothetical protein [Sulfitobacter sp. S190]UWR23867.1 hypothetical protein K3756_07915 [Sulfitobacter sp. S190]
MPLRHLIFILALVIVAAGVTVWLLSQCSAALLVAALPAFMILAVAVRWFTR